MHLSILAGSANPKLAAAIGARLGVEPCRRSVERFDDGELHVELLESVRGDDVYLIQSTSAPVDEHLVEILFLADACRRAGAARVTAVIPYFGYARQDRRAAGREAVGARVAAGLLESAGLARVVAVDLHAPEIEGFFRIPVEHLSAAGLLARQLEPVADGGGVIVAPDLGAVKLAERYQSWLHLPVVAVHKTRISGSEVSLRAIIGDVRGRVPIIVDDMITTGGTVEAAVRGLLEAGCVPAVSVSATHGVFAGPAVSRLQGLPLRQLVTTNSVESPVSPRAVTAVVDLAPILSDAITRLHGDRSLEGLLAHH